MANVNLGEIVRDGKLQIARAVAIEEYAKVEQSLSWLFAGLLGTTRDKAGVVFFRLTNTHSRNSIIESLLQKNHGLIYRTYWSGTQQHGGLFTLLRQLDSRRNEIVHWHVVMSVGGDPAKTSESLHPPNFWNRTPTTQSIGLAELEDFTLKADFVGRSINMFTAFTDPSMNPHFAADNSAAWQGIFEQPITYPPPDTHPLSRQNVVPGIPRPSSQG